MADLLIVRHGESEWNAAGRWQGWADAPLSEAGEAQARAAIGELAGARLQAVAASDLQRARRTAEILADGLGLGPVHIDEGLRERDVGDFTGLTREEIEGRWPGILADWRAGRVQQAPNGEGPEFLERVLAALDRVAERFAGQRVLVPLLRRDRLGRPEVALVLFVLAGGVGNAAITGGLSGPAVRYQARLAWVFVLVPGALLAVPRRRPELVAEERNRSGA